MDKTDIIKFLKKYFNFIVLCIIPVAHLLLLELPFWKIIAYDVCIFFLFYTIFLLHAQKLYEFHEKIRNSQINTIIKIIEKKNER